MKTKHNYVECHNCKWRLEHQPDFDWAKNPCRRCNNVREIIDPKEVLCNMCGEGMCHNIEVPSGLWSTDDPHGLYDAKVQGVVCKGEEDGRIVMFRDQIAGLVG